MKKIFRAHGRKMDRRIDVCICTSFLVCASVDLYKLAYGSHFEIHVFIYSKLNFLKPYQHFFGSCQSLFTD